MLTEGSVAWRVPLAAGVQPKSKTKINTMEMSESRDLFIVYPFPKQRGNHLLSHMAL
jgi:hypothetical protein